MVDTFFTGVLAIKTSDEIIVKSEKHVFYIVKCDPEHILCVLKEETMNTGLISLSIKNKNSKLCKKN